MNWPLAIATVAFLAGIAFLGLAALGKRHGFNRQNSEDHGHG